MLNITTVIIELRDDDVYHIGVTDGENDLFIFRCNSYGAAEECATEFKKWLEEMRRKKGGPWLVCGSPRLRKHFRVQ